MIIAVASGKGGTGKTTIATNLALSITNTQFLDCDVEEPNAHIFLKTPLTDTESVNLTYPKINKKKCTNCGKCAQFCAYNALAVVPNEVLVFPELCHSCTGCALICPEHAITWNTRSIGTIDHGSTDNLDFYQGSLNIGEMQATPIIKKLKQKIDPTKNVIIDVPPGTSCPVIEAVTDTDYCILVTEPTPFGFHDLKLALEVIKHLYIPHGVIINRDGIGNNTIEHYCHTHNIPILLKIPEEKTIAQLYSNGIPLTQHSTSWKQQFTNLFTTIKNEVTA